MAAPVLRFDEVTMAFPAGEAGPRTVLRDVSFGLPAGRSVALVGRSGDALLDGWIFAARTAPVDTVRVGGRLVVEGGRHVAGEAVARRFERTMRGLLADA